MTTGQTLAPTPYIADEEMISSDLTFLAERVTDLEARLTKARRIYSRDQFELENLRTMRVEDNRMSRALRDDLESARKTIDKQAARIDALRFDPEQYNGADLREKLLDELNTLAVSAWSAKKDLVNERVEDPTSGSLSDEFFRRHALARNAEATLRVVAKLRGVLNAGAPTPDEPRVWNESAPVPEEGTRAHRGALDRAIVVDGAWTCEACHVGGGLHWYYSDFPLIEILDGE